MCIEGERNWICVGVISVAKIHNFIHLNQWNVRTSKLIRFVRTKKNEKKAHKYSHIKRSRISNKWKILVNENVDNVIIVVLFVLFSTIMRESWDQEKTREEERRSFLYS